MRSESIVICGPGKVRKENQDNYYLNGAYRRKPSSSGFQCIQSSGSGPALFAVADGMGGEQHGSLASLIAVRSLDTVDKTTGADGMRQYLLDRNQEICGLIMQNGGSRSGTTFVGLCCTEWSVDMVNIGDSRTYLFREGRLFQLSTDHTAVHQMVELGIIKAEEYRRHPGRHRLTQHLGIFPDEMIIDPCVVHRATLSNDLFLLCSDGLYDMVEDSEIEAILKSAETIQTGAFTLFSAAMNAGGRDNITVMLIKIRL